MASYNKQTSEDATTRTPCMVAAVKLLDHLERLRLFPDERLPVPFVMRRLSELIVERLAQPREEFEWNIREEDNWNVTTESEEEDDQEVCTGPDEEANQPPAHCITAGNRSSTALASTGQDNPILAKFKADLGEIAWLDGAMYIDLQFLSCVRLGENKSRSTVKEFAVTCEGTETVAWITVRPPEDAIPRVRPNEYAVNVLHSVDWESGDIDVEDLCSSIERLFRGRRMVYVKGVDKANLLVDELRVPRHLISLLVTLPRLGELRWDVRRACPYHEKFASGTRCAVRHAVALKNRHLQEMCQPVTGETSNRSSY